MNQTTPESLNTLIYKTNLLLKNNLQKHLSEFSLTTEQWALLRHLYTKDGINQQQLALALFKKKAVITRILNSMEEQNLLIRQASKHDKREFLIFLTPSGRFLYEKTLPSLNEYRAWLDKQLSSSDMDALMNLLGSLNETLINQKKD